ncbi:MAG: hypothetical protein M1839_004577 [Geoglossum umbratile]|nr:MAG: hypothetical protein M1839_004577 [Geoglossum umbratile]
MPPVRTVPAKAVRSERTHEENQERAYIAASRRSDRSIEARVESARRASEIHKRRTGRSLRVTEQDVINEEMYEEEDNNLPYPYRRLAAGLQTGSPDYNRRLAAYLTNQEAMRNALDQAVTSSYAQTYPNAPQFVQNQSMYQSPFAMQQTQQMFYNPPPYHPTLAAPYPASHPPGLTQHSPISSVDLPQRPATIPLRGVGTSSPLEPCHSRSMSLAVYPLASPPLTPTSTFNAHTTQPRPTPTPQQIPANLPSNYNHQMMVQQQHQFMRSTSGMQSTASMQSTMCMRPALDMQSTSGLNPPCGDCASSYTMSLPPEPQMLLGNTPNPNDPLTSAMAGGNETLPSYYNYDSYVPGANPKASSCDSLPETLAPNVLDLIPLDSYTTSTLDQPHTQVPNGVYGVSSEVPSLNRNTSSIVTNDGSTPGADGEWGAFIDNDWGQGNELSDSLYT